METKIYNIDSVFRNTDSFPDSNSFTYNMVDISPTTTPSSTNTRIEPFNEKNVIEMNILSIELETTVNDNQYFFLRINNLGNILHKNNNTGITRYVGKIIYNLDGTYNLITNKIKFDQPQDIQYLNISLEDREGNLVPMDIDFSFTMELVLVNNSILKNYEQIRFYSEPVMDRILQAKMLAYYEKMVDPSVNNSLTSTYNSDLVNLNTNIEYRSNGIRNNYENKRNANIVPSFFTNMD